MSDHSTISQSTRILLTTDLSRSLLEPGEETVVPGASCPPARYTQPVQHYHPHWVHCALFVMCCELFNLEMDVLHPLRVLFHRLRLWDVWINHCNRVRVRLLCSHPRALLMLICFMVAFPWLIIVFVSCCKIGNSWFLYKTTEEVSYNWSICSHSCCLYCSLSTTLQTIV